MCMKKIFFIPLFLLFIVFNASAGKFYDYLEHCNFSAGFNFALGSSVDTGDSKDLISIKDGFGDYYSFKIDSSDLKNIYLPITVDLKFPFYYNENNNFGININVEFMYLSIAISSLDLYYTYKISDKFEASVFGGWSMAFVQGSCGKLRQAFSGDLGFYTSSGKFIRPGTEMTFSGRDPKGFNLGVSVKYRPFQYDKLFFSLGYRFISSFSVSDYNIKLDNVKISSSEISMGSVNIQSSHNIFITFGWGL